MPKHEGIKHCMMKIGEEMIEGVGEMFTSGKNNLAK